MKRTFWNFFHIILVFKGALCLVVLVLGRSVLKELCSLLIILAALGVGYILNRRAGPEDRGPRVLAARRRAAIAGIIVFLAVTALDFTVTVSGLNLGAFQFFAGLPYEVAGLSVIWDLMVRAGMDEPFRLTGKVG